MKKYKMCPACGKPMKTGTTKELENHFWPRKEGEKGCKWRLPIVGFVEKNRKKWKPFKRRQDSPKYTRKEQPITKAKPKGKEIKSKAELEKAIKEIEEGD